MIIPNKIKDATLNKLNHLLKCYLIKTFEVYGYNSEEKSVISTRSKRAKMILETIGRIQKNKEMDKETLEKLFDMYKTYNNGSGGK